MPPLLTAAETMETPPHTLRKASRLEPKNHLFEKEHHLNHPPPFLGFPAVNFPEKKYSCSTKCRETMESICLYGTLEPL